MNFSRVIHELERERDLKEEEEEEEEEEEVRCALTPKCLQGQSSIVAMLTKSFS